MKYYFQLQSRIIIRRFREMGIHPIPGILLCGIGFALLSLYLFYATSYGAAVYGAFALTILSKLSAKERNDFLKSIFSTKSFYQVRVLENVLAAIPFLLFLLYKGSYGILLGLLPAAVVLGFMRFEDRLNYTLPTPFNRFPFEFAMGFRKSFALYMLAYFLTYQAISVANVNLGIFSIALVFLLSMSNYIRPENEYFVWIYAASPKTFLLKKMLTAVYCSSILTLPLALVMGFYAPDKWAILIGLQCLGYLLLCTMILAKYSAYPGELNLPQAILFGLSLWFPPMLLIVIPMFYSQAIKRLNPILQ